MDKIPDIVPITDLRQDATAILKRMTKLRKPLIIKQRGRAAAVMVSIKEYEHSQRELELLRLLAQGEKEIEAGKGYDLYRENPTAAAAFRHKSEKSLSLFLPRKRGNNLDCGRAWGSTPGSSEFPVKHVLYFTQIMQTLFNNLFNSMNFLLKLYISLYIKICTCALIINELRYRKINSFTTSALFQMHFFGLYKQ